MVKRVGTSCLFDHNMHCHKVALFQSLKSVNSKSVLHGGSPPIGCEC